MTAMETQAMSPGQPSADQLGDLFFDVARLDQPLNLEFVARVVGMTHAYVATRYAVPPSLPIAADAVFRSMYRVCAKGFAEGTISVDA